MKTITVYAENARLKKRVRELRKQLEACWAKHKYAEPTKVPPYKTRTAPGIH